MYPAQSISVSSVSSLRPTLAILFSLSSSLILIASDALREEKMPTGFKAESP